jgi:hypothetical protein
MGGALTQWYLKYVGDLPAAVLVAPWLSHSTLLDGPKVMMLDPLLFLLSSLAWSATPWVRSPRHAANLFITNGALITPEELYDRLGLNRKLWCCSTIRRSGHRLMMCAHPCCG